MAPLPSGCDVALLQTLSLIRAGWFIDPSACVSVHVTITCNCLLMSLLPSLWNLCLPHPFADILKPLQLSSSYLTPIATCSIFPSFCLPDTGEQQQWQVFFRKAKQTAFPWHCCPPPSAPKLAFLSKLFPILIAQ